MKSNPTFDEMSKIFAAIAKAEEKAEAYLRNESEYAAASSEYAESDYNWQMGLAMSRCYEALNKARNAMNAAFKNVIKLMDATTDEFEDEQMRRFAKMYYDPRKFIFNAKYNAIQIAKSIAL